MRGMEEKKPARGISTRGCLKVISHQGGGCRCVGVKRGGFLTKITSLQNKSKSVI